MLANAILVFYLPGVFNGFVYDDYAVILEETRGRGVADLLHVFVEPHYRGLPYYRPVTRFSLLAQKAVHGDRPGLFHLGNAVLAGGAAAAALMLLRSPALGIGAGPALLAAAAFAVHPIASSCVYPIASGRETLLPAVVILAAAAAWLRGRIGLALALLPVALLAKEQAVVLPAVFMWADLCGLAPQAPARRLAAWPAWARRHAGPIAIAIAYFVARQALFGGGEWRPAILDNPTGPLLSMLFALQVACAPFAALHYEPEVAAWFSAARLAAAGAVVSGLLVAARRVRAPAPRVLLFWGGWFVLVQLPTSNLLLQDARFEERYVFLALLAIPAVAAGIATPLWERPDRRRALAVAGSIAIAALGAVSLGRAAAFRDDVAFATAWIQSEPSAPEPHHMLGLAAAEQGKAEEAIGHYRKVLELAPATPEIHINIASALVTVGRDAEARTHAEEALRIDPGHPEAHLLLGTILDRQGQIDSAIEQYRAALASEPYLAAAHAQLGAALARQGKTGEAAAHLRESLRLDPLQPGVQRALDALTPP